MLIKETHAFSIFQGFRLEAHTFIGKELTVDRDRLGRARHILAHNLPVVRRRRNAIWVTRQKQIGAEAESNHWPAVA
jgi:hypothetical protein